MKNREATCNLGIEKLTSDVRKLGLMLIWLKILAMEFILGTRIHV